MRLSDKQADFSRKFITLLSWAYSVRPELKLVLSWGERSIEDQKRLIRDGKSWRLDSLHLTKLAHDIILFDGPDPIWDCDEYEWLGIKAEELGLVWGGRWKQKDGGHFEYANP